MKKFEQVLKEKAHLTKIKQAKKTISSAVKPSSRMSSSKVGAQAQLLLKLYQNKSYDSIPAYKLLRTAGLQQYTRGFIERGYGINLGKLVLIGDDDRKLLYEELKVLPGHTIKLDKIIEALAKSSYSRQLDQGEECEELMIPQNQFAKMNQVDDQYQKQLQRVMNEYTPLSDQKKKTFNSKNSQKRGSIINATESKYSKTKYFPPIAKDKTADFRKKQPSTKPTIRKSNVSTQNANQKRSSLSKILQAEAGKSMSSQQALEINLQIDKVKALNRSFDGALMSSTIANIDIEELVYAFSGLIVSKTVVAQQPKIFMEKHTSAEQIQENLENIDDQVGQILRESYMHPLYRQEVEEEINFCEEVQSEGQEQQIDLNTRQNQFSFEKNKMMDSSFLGGAQSVQFGIDNPLKIFDQPSPTEIDYFKPTIDSVSNFIKNIILAAKMEREIPIMAAAYLQQFLQKSKTELTSLNYKRLLVSVLLLSSKIWDDESFQTPSFSKTFPEYSTVLLNEMEKQIVKHLDYKLKLDKKEYSKTYFLLRKFIKSNNKSYQNRKLNLKRIRQMQSGLKKDYKSHFLTKRNSF